MDIAETAATVLEKGAAEAGKNVGRRERNICLWSGSSLAVYGVSSLLRKNYWRGAAMTAVGSYLLYRGKTGRCSLYGLLGVSTNGEEEERGPIKESVTVDRPRGEVYRFWRNLENLPRFMKYLESVTPAGMNRYHWIAETPGKKRLEWDSEITEERENEFIRWRSVPGSQVETEGQVTFAQAPDGMGTEVTLEMTYHPPGEAESSMGKLFHFVTSRFVRKELKRFKKLVEKEKGVEGAFETRPPATSL